MRHLGHMIAFFADNHYGTHGGRLLHQKLPTDEPVFFAEDDLSELPAITARKDCRLLMLNWIGETCGLPHPGPEIEAAVKAYVESGRPLMLLHGASAAFWQWPWWRRLVGLRWVREGDPDGAEPSVHPIRPYTTKVTNTKHPLTRRLKPFDLETDEIYIQLEQTGPITVLMETTIEEGTFPQAYICQSAAGGHIAGFLPGHAPHAFEAEALLHNIRELIQYLLETPTYGGTAR